MVQMAMIPMRIRTRCQDSSSRDWSVDINVILKALSYSPSPVLRTPSGTYSEILNLRLPLRAREKLVLFPSKDSTQAIWCNISLALRGSRRLSISEYVPEGVRRTGEGPLGAIFPILSAKIIKKNRIMAKI